MPNTIDQGTVGGVAFSPDGKTLLTGSSDGTAKLWDAGFEQPEVLVLSHQHQVTCIAFGPDGKTLLTGSGDASAVLWDAATGLRLIPPLQHAARVNSVAFSPDGRRILTGSGGASGSSTKGEARLWDAATGTPITPPLAHRGTLNVVAFNPDGKTFVTGCEDKTLRLWDAATSRPLGESLPQDGSVDTGAIHPDGKAFLSGYDNGDAQLWDVANRKRVGNPFVHPGALGAVAFSRDGRALFTGCEDRSARLWDVATGALLIPPLRHPGRVFGAAISPDGKTLLTGCREGMMAQLWDAATGLPLGPRILHPSAVCSVAFSPDGKAFATGTYQSDSKTRVYRSIAELPDDPERVATWVEVFTGLALDAEKGDIRSLDNAAWLAARDRLDERGGPPETEPPPRIGPRVRHNDPTGVAAAMLQNGRWEEAEALLDEATRADPFDFASRAARGRLLVFRSRYAEAAAVFDRAAELKPSDAFIGYDRAVAHLLACDGAGFRAAAEAMLGRFRDSENIVASGRVAYACIYGPDAVRDMPELIRAAERTAPAFPGGVRIVGAALYRAGRYPEALSRFEESHKVFQPRAWDWLFLAMIHSRLGHPDEAIRMLEEAQRWIAEADRPDEGKDKALPRWDDTYDAPLSRLLRGEAEALIRFDPLFPANPFAP